MILDVFHMGGMMDLLMQQLRRLVRYLMPCEPRCFSIMGEMLSGPWLWMICFFDCLPDLDLCDNYFRLV